jgi:probable rRNA maturation factor
LECRDAELSIVLVTDEEIARLNEAYLHRSGPTNVIAFPMREGLFGNINPQLLGDVVISMDTAALEAEMSGLTTETRFDQLLVHGILHLFGYDHEKNLEDAGMMELKEEEMLLLLHRLPLS